jgi:hypothetical protein
MRAVWQLLSIGVLNVAALVCGAAQHRANAQMLFQWVQVGPEGTSVVRAITDDACPKVRFDSGKIATNIRSESNQKFDVEVPAAFPVRVCEVPVPAGSITGTLGEKVLPIARPNPRRIVVIGDSGCRVEKDKIQNCKNPDEWPFARIAAAAAATRPDLVIHVGDYEYRAALCPAGEEKKCGGSPEPYSWEAWKADFFAPAKPLLEAAPWIMVRGNHELCRRAGEGWFRFLDTAAFDGSCRDSTDPYVVKLGAFGVMVVDGAEAAKYGGDLGQLTEKVRGRLAEWQANLPDELWIATHPPIGGELAKPQAPGQTKPMPGNLSMVVSGHFHSFHTATFGGASTPQTVIGLGGAMLDTPEEIAENRAALGASDSSPSADFGYMVWDKSAGVWSGTLFDSHGKPTKSHCELKERALHCDH